MASQATTAIEHARLYREATRRLAEAKVLQEVMVVAASTLNFEQALKSTIEALHRLLGIERLGFFLPESPGYLVAHPSYIGFEPNNGQLRVPAARSAVGWVSKTGQPLLIEDVTTAAHYYELAPDTKSELCVPVRLGGQVLAVLNAESPRRNAFDQEDLRLFNAIAAELAVALENAQLFEKEHQLARQQQALLDIFTDLTAELESAALFQRIIERAIEVIPNAEAGSLIIPRGDHFGFAAVVGFDLEQLEDIPFTINDFTIPGAPPRQSGTPFQKVDRLTQEELIHFNRTHHPERYEALVKAGRLTEIQSSLRAILVVGDKLLGSISVDSLTKIDAFTEEDEQILLLFANQAAIAIHNARLFEEIRAAEANYRDLFDNANDLIFTLDSAFKISSANKVLVKTSGYSQEELIGTHVTKFISDRQSRELLKLLKEQLRSTGVPSSFELAFRSKNGQEKLLEVTMRVKRRGRRPTELHFIARDITRRRELETQLQQIEKLSTIGKLVAGVAHELNNPLTSIVGYTNLLQESDLSSSHQKDLQVIARQAERARLIVRDLLTFARNITLETEPVDINDVVQNSLSLLKPQLQEHNIQVISRLNFGLPMITADPRRMEQVFVNLITNALQELVQQPQPGHIIIETDFSETAICISIADNGPGIPDHHLNRVFDPFFSTKQVGEGTGLGLSICFGIVTEHRGRIWVENQPSGGTIFFIELPLTNLSSPDQRDGAQRTEPISQTSLAAEQHHILVVDDEPSLLVLLSRVLEQKGHTVETAPNGQIALEKLANRQYDLIICDILMPDMFGTELYNRVTEYHPSLASRFIFITGNATDPETHAFLEQSGLIWLTKPFLPVDVETAVANALRNVAPTTQN
jgi:two-component system NtrC family sensor kinase